MTCPDELNTWHNTSISAITAVGVEEKTVFSQKWTPEKQLSASRQTITATGGDQETVRGTDMDERIILTLSGLQSDIPVNSRQHNSASTSRIWRQCMYVSVYIYNINLKDVIPQRAEKRNDTWTYTQFLFYFSGRVWLQCVIQQRCRSSTRKRFTSHHLRLCPKARLFFHRWKCGCSASY